MTAVPGYFSNETDAKLEMLDALRREGHSANQIAAALRERFGGPCTRSMVLGKLHRIRLKNRKQEKSANLERRLRPVSEWSK